MKQRLTTYTFTPGAAGAGTVDFSGVSGFDKRGLLAIINGAATLYAAGSPTLSGAWSGAVLTLAVATTGMSGTDPLLVLYDDAASPASAAKQDTGNVSLAALVTALAGVLKNELVDQNGVPIQRGNPLLTHAVDTVILPFRPEQWKTSTTSNAGSNMGPTENWTSSSVYESNFVAGGYDLPLAITVNAAALGATMYGTIVEGYIFGSVFNLIRCVANSAAVIPSNPCTVSIDGVAYQIDSRVPWLDYPVQPQMDNGLIFQRARVAHGLHDGEHHVVLQFPMASDGVTNRYWRFEGFEVERTATQQPPPTAEYFDNAQAVSLSTSSSAPSLISIRAQTSPPVLALRNIYLTNPNGSATTFYWRVNLPNGPGASSSWMQRTIAAGDGAWLWPTDAPRPQEIQIYASAANALAKATYWR